MSGKWLSGYSTSRTEQKIEFFYLMRASNARVNAIMDYIRDRYFGDLHAWLTDDVLSPRQTLQADELIREVAGESLTAGYFLDCVTQRYEALH